MVLMLLQVFMNNRYTLFAEGNFISGRKAKTVLDLNVTGRRQEEKAARIWIREGLRM